VPAEVRVPLARERVAPVAATPAGSLPFARFRFNVVEVA
jgi:hypothetical protein